MAHEGAQAHNANARCTSPRPRTATITVVPRVKRRCLTKRMGGWGRVRERRIIQLVGCLDILFRMMRLDEIESAKQQVIISKLPRYYVNVSSRVPDLPLFDGSPLPKSECMTMNPLISVPTNAKRKKKSDK